MSSCIFRGPFICIINMIHGVVERCEAFSCSLKLLSIAKKIWWQLSVVWDVVETNFRVFHFHSEIKFSSYTRNGRKLLRIFFFWSLERLYCFYRNSEILMKILEYGKKIVSDIESLLESAISDFCSVVCNIRVFIHPRKKASHQSTKAPGYMLHVRNVSRRVRNATREKNNVDEFLHPHLHYTDQAFSAMKNIVRGKYISIYIYKLTLNRSLV